MENHRVQHSRAKDAQGMFRLWLQKQFTDRCKKNARYSLRAFAKYLEIDPSSLSQILGGKRNISAKIRQEICNKLSATPNDLYRFGIITTATDEDLNYLQLDSDLFAAISDWCHYAILEITYVDGFQTDPKWIAKKLSITVEETKSAVERLKRLGLLLEENGRYIKSSRRITNRGTLDTSAAHKELQRQVVQKALLAIDECPQEKKDITSMTMAIDVKNLDKARSLIQKFRRDLCELLEDGEQSVVYNLGVQLYPISENN